MKCHYLITDFLFVVYPASCLPDLSAVDASLKVMELQVQAIKNQLREEAEAIPKAKVYSSRPC